MQLQANIISQVICRRNFYSHLSSYLMVVMIELRYRKYCLFYLKYMSYLNYFLLKYKLFDFDFQCRSSLIHVHNNRIFYSQLFIFSFLPFLEFKPWIPLKPDIWPSYLDRLTSRNEANKDSYLDIKKWIFWIRLVHNRIRI